jgi:hypothetical protein
MRVDWDGADVDKNRRLIAMRRAGKTSTEIARELGISRNAVIGRMNRLQKSGRLAAYGRPGPVPKPKPDWAEMGRDERKALIAKWQGENLPVRACVLKVRNASDNAIRSAAASFGMPFPDGRVGRGRKAAPVYRLDDIRAAREREALVEAEEKQRLEEAVSAVEIKAPTCEPVALLDLENHHCRFVVSRGMFCGGAANLIKRQPWCPFHRHIVYEQNPEKRKSA